MPRYECSSCNKSLHGFPKIRIEAKIYCYSCAKRIVTALDRPAEERQAKEFKLYDAQQAKWSAWNQNLKSALPSETTHKVIIVGVAVGCAVLMQHVVFFFLPGLIVGLVADMLYYNSQKKSWIRQNPEPPRPSLSSIEFVRNRIELVGGRSGTQLSSGYQKQILERDGYKCQICGDNDRLEVHHIIPQAKGGKHYPANLVTLCYGCHVEENWFGHKHKMR